MIILDYVESLPTGTVWGLRGTPVLIYRVYSHKANALISIVY
jgi:hypothetical protein